MNWEEVICALDGCNNKFTPRVWNQRYCHPSHKTKAEAARKRVEHSICPGPAGCGASNLDEALALVEQAGGLVSFSEKQSFATVGKSREKGRLLVAAASDFHLCSNYQQLTHLHHFYDLARERGVEKMFWSGDITDGRHVFRGQEQEIFRHSYSGQRDYAIKNLPGGVENIVIGGNHDFDWAKNGSGDVVADIAERRGDIVYLGYSTACYQLGPIKFVLRHPKGKVGGRSRSLKLQAVSEAAARRFKPHVIFVGHYHHTCFLPHFEGIAAFQLGCFQSDTPFLVEGDMTPDLCGLILEIFHDGQKITRLVQEWVFYQPIPRDF